jgi:zinc protease
MQKNSFAGRTVRFEYPNGMTLLVLENHANPTVSIYGFLKAGAYFNPSGRRGLASMTARMLGKGTTRRSKLEIAEALESVGARVGLSANTFTVAVSGQGLSHDLPLLVGTLAEELREPTFPADELQKLQLRTIAAIKQEDEETRSRAVERLTQIIYPPNNPFYQLSADALIEQIESIGVDDLRSFYETRYGASTLLLVVVGAVEAEQARLQIGDHLGDWITGPEPVIELPFTPLQTEALRDYVPMRDKANVDIVIGHASGLRRANPDYLAAQIANRALGQSTLSSRLGMKIRDEMGLTYGINSSFMESGLGDGPFLISVTVAPANITPAIETTNEIVNDFLANGINEEELRDEQSSWIGSFKVGLATNAGIAGQIASAELHGLGVEYLDRFPDQINALTKDEIDAAIRRYIHPERATTVIAGTID